MANQRSHGKSLIGAQVHPALHEAVERWKVKYFPGTKTNFLTAAAIDKLKRDGIEVDEKEILQDRRSRFPSEGKVAYKIKRPNKPKPPT